MTGATSVLIVLAAAAGFGAWLKIASVGGKLLVGAILTTALMNLLHFTAGITLSWTGFAVLAMALPGLVKIGASLRRDVHGPEVRTAFFNPSIVLVVAVGGMMLIRGFDHYSPYSWDEFASWLYWPKEAFAAGTYLAKKMGWQTLLYTQGWPMAVLFPHAFFEQFAAARGAAVAVVWHAALLGLFYDALRAHVQRALPFAPKAFGSLLGWTIVLGLLAVEATWTLMPDLLLVEKPQIYMIAGSLAFVLLGLATDKDPERSKYIFAAGVALAGAYLVKVTALAVVLPTSLAVLMMLHTQRSKGGNDWRAAVRDLALLLLPVAATYLWWAAVRPFDFPGSCFGDPFALPAIHEDMMGKGLETLQRLAIETTSYLASYKLPLSLIGAAGVGAAFFDRRLAPVAWALVAYAIIYFASLIPLYAWCTSDSLGLEWLDSLQRYLRVPLRIFHLIAPGLLALAVLRRFGRADNPILTSLPRRRATHIALAIMVAAGGIYQLRATDAVIRNAVTRDQEPRESAAEIRAVERDAIDMVALINSLKFPRVPTVTIIAQEQTGFELRIARYRALSKRRNQRFLYHVDNSYSWGPEAQNHWMRAVSTDHLIAHFRSRDILWPIKTDAWMRSIISRLVDDESCADKPEIYFLVRTGGERPAFQCLVKRSDSAG